MIEINREDIQLAYPFEKNHSLFLWEGNKLKTRSGYVDDDIIDFLLDINIYPWIETVESCSGHENKRWQSKTPWIRFKTSDERLLDFLAGKIYGEWKIEQKNKDVMYITGKKNDGMEHISLIIEEHETKPSWCGNQPILLLHFHQNDKKTIKSWLKEFNNLYYK